MPHWYNHPVMEPIRLFVDRVLEFLPNVLLTGCGKEDRDRRDRPGHPNLLTLIRGRIPSKKRSNRQGALFPTLGWSLASTPGCKRHFHRVPFRVSLSRRRARSRSRCCPTAPRGDE